MLIDLILLNKKIKSELNYISGFFKKGLKTKKQHFSVMRQDKFNRLHGNFAAFLNIK